MIDEIESSWLISSNDQTWTIKTINLYHEIVLVACCESNEVYLDTLNRTGHIRKSFMKSTIDALRLSA